jgi:hypothetical protein
VLEKPHEKGACLKRQDKGFGAVATRGAPTGAAFILVADATAAVRKRYSRS